MSLAPRTFPRLTAGSADTCASKAPGGAPWQASEVLAGRLYVGSYDDALSVEGLRAHHVRHIVSVARECLPPAAVVDGVVGGSWYSLPIDDHSDAPLLPALSSVVAFISTALLRGDGAVLIHCRMGYSRSVAVAVAFLMAEGAAYGLSATNGGADSSASPYVPYAVAMDHVRSCRPRVSPNIGFIIALRRFEGALRLRGTTPSCSVSPAMATVPSCTLGTAHAPLMDCAYLDRCASGCADSSWSSLDAMPRMASGAALGVASASSLSAGTVFDPVGEARGVAAGAGFSPSPMVEADVDSFDDSVW